jgi:hypothetical protein
VKPANVAAALSRHGKDSMLAAVRPTELLVLVTCKRSSMGRIEEPPPAVVAAGMPARLLLLGAAGFHMGQDVARCGAW